jgi:hypothetical protein
MKTYFLERCSGGTKSGDFWKTIKPFFSKKGSSGEQIIVLNESDKIVNDQKEVANHFNNLFSTVAENIGKDTVYDPSDHPSLIEIMKQNDCTNKFVFEKVTTDKVEKIINNINNSFPKVARFCSPTSSLAKGYDSGPPSLHPWQI